VAAQRKSAAEPHGRENAEDQREHEARGRQVQPRSIYNDDRLAWEELHPEFLVDGWCYAPPRQPTDAEWDVEPMTRMRTDGVPLCPGEDWPAWLDEPIAEGAE